MPLPSVTDMNVLDETMTTMRVNWVKAEGATGYMLLYKALNASQPGVDQEVRDMHMCTCTVAQWLRTSV